MATHQTQDEADGYATQYAMGETATVAQPAVSRGQLATLNWETRFAYDERLKSEYDISPGQWASLCDSVFPGVTDPNAILMALRYCAARKLDIFKRPISIVPMWRKGAGKGDRGRMVNTIWPGIMEVRTTALRTKQCGGNDAAEWGDDIRMTFENKHTNDQGITDVTILHLVLPRWCRYTVRRIIDKKERTFVGPQVYWLETYAQTSRFSEIPNAMWEKRPRGQLDKCAEAAAWRRAFPEELPGGGYIADEMEGKELTTEVAEIQQLADEDTNRTLERRSLEARGSTSTGWTKPVGGETPAIDAGKAAPERTGEPTATKAPEAATGAPKTVIAEEGPPRPPKPPPAKTFDAAGKPVEPRPAPTPGSEAHMDAYQHGKVEARPAENGPPRPPPARGSTPPQVAPPAAAEASSPATAIASTVQPATPPEPPKTAAQSAAPAQAANEPPRPPKLSPSTLTTATVRADAAGSGSPSNGPMTVVSEKLGPEKVEDFLPIDARQSWLAARPNFAGPFNQVEMWVTRLFDMAPTIEDLASYLTDYVEPHMDAVFPQDRDVIYGLHRQAEKRFET